MPRVSAVNVEAQPFVNFADVLKHAGVDQHTVAIYTRANLQGDAD